MTTLHIGFHGLELFGLNLHFAGGGRGSGFAGSAWRGLLGQALCRAVCAYPEPACAACPQLAGCAYPTLFKPLDATRLPPFWLHGWQRTRAGWGVGIRWLGAGHVLAIGQWLDGLATPAGGLIFDNVVVCLQQATLPDSATPVWRPGKGWLRQPASRALATAEDKPPAACRVKSLAPLVSKHGGDPLFGALHTRLQRLVSQHGDGTALPRPSSPWHAEVIATRACRIPLARRLLSGTEWEIALKHIDPLAWRLLTAGVELHAGGQTGMGCGRYGLILV